MHYFHLIEFFVKKYGIDHICSNCHEPDFKSFLLNWKETDFAEVKTLPY